MGRKRVSGYCVDEHGNAVGSGQRVRVYELTGEGDSSDVLTTLYLHRTAADTIEQSASAFRPYTGQETAIRAQPAVGDTLIQVDSTTNFKLGDVIRFQSGTDKRQRTIKAITDADTLELTEAIGFAFPVGSKVGSEGGTGYWQAWVEDDVDYEWSFENEATGEEGERQPLYIRVPTAKDGPTGGMVAWTTDTAPTDWLLCYGQAVSRATYAALFDVIGVVYGAGDGATTFNLPDTRGRVLVGQDDMGGVAANRLTAANALNVSGGAATHTLTESEIPSHSHTTPAHSHSHTHGAHAHGKTVGDQSNQFGLSGNWGGDGNGADATQNVNDTTPSADATTAAPTTNATGGGGAHNNVQPYLTLNWIIRT